MNFICSSWTQELCLIFNVWAQSWHLGIQEATGSGPGGGKGLTCWKEVLKKKLFRRLPPCFISSRGSTREALCGLCWHTVCPAEEQSSREQGPPTLSPLPRAKASSRAQQARSARKPRAGHRQERRRGRGEAARPGACPWSPHRQGAQVTG